MNTKKIENSFKKVKLDVIKLEKQNDNTRRELIKYVAKIKEMLEERDEILIAQLKAELFELLSDDKVDFKKLKENSSKTKSKPKKTSKKIVVKKKKSTKESSSKKKTN